MAQAETQPSTAGELIASQPPGNLPWPKGAVLTPWTTRLALQCAARQDVRSDCVAG